MLLTCRIGSYRFALPAASVERILPMASPVPLPGAPPGVTGLLTVRGGVLPLLDPGPCLGLPDRPVSADQHLILVSAATRFLVWVDRAEEIVQVTSQTIDLLDTARQHGPVVQVARLADAVLPVLSPQALDPGALLRRAAEVEA